MGATKTYHHGDLRAALVREALRLLEEEGEAGISLRAIARAAGVSQTAPYSHFANKQELLAAVAAAGFERFTEAMEREASGSRSPQKRLQALGVGYVRFALDNPALFRLMFESAVPAASKDEALRRAADHSYGVLQEAVAAVHGPRSQTEARASWSLVHGLAHLLLSGRIERPTSLEGLRNLVKSVNAHR